MLEHGDVEHGILSIGQIIGLVRDIPTCAELIERIMTEAEAILHKRFPAMTKEGALAK
jgi:nitronate monooxygenase